MLARLHHASPRSGKREMKSPLPRIEEGAKTHAIVLLEGATAIVCSNQSFGQAMIRWNWMSAALPAVFDVLTNTASGLPARAASVTNPFGAVPAVAFPSVAT